ncbi:hypothetical protein EST38_g5160 [Candolleomyces aberdarensis]|uniref:Protein kinase domain-containing protein n=1 Tax=Candolleomyces aberdarensis TaxID=2316362 RepID=A0A4Q2DL48_9AGAR|nr:hypothetical protein EST38_g5160 [Candolleomyces aberdarensis]
MAASGASGSSSISQSPSALFDPADVTVTNKLTARYLNDGEARTKPMLNNYIRHARIGGGQHGEVYLCFRIDSRLPTDDPRRLMPAAMKSVRRNNPKEERLGKLRPPNAKLPTNRDPNSVPLAAKVSATEQKIRKEIAIMKKLRHPHVVRLYEVIDDQLQSKIYMIMEYLGGGEVKWRNDHSEPVLSVAQTRRIIRDAVLGLEYLHYQGIIHRDIKPANLLWTEDRSQVKIGDFGVSHFSYAQRLAAAGKAAEKEHPEAFLMDDSDLSKRAGTPSFLAPEVVWEYSSSSPFTSQTELASPRSTGTLQSLTSPRPPVTKSIDIWALGVTLYCLLFGKVPFTPFSDHGGEFELYRVICNSDWAVAPTMGADEVPTGGRHPSSSGPGAAVIFLLDRFLQKDVQNRITLNEVKVRAPLTPPPLANPWILQDLPDPERWIHTTSAVSKIQITAGEASDAMSSVRFRWNWGARVTRRISNLFSKPRGSAGGPTRAPPTLSQIGEGSSSSRRSNGVRSDPHGSSGGETNSRATASSMTSPSRIRPRVQTNAVYHVASSPGLFPARPSEKKDKGKKKEDSSGRGSHHHHHTSHGGSSHDVPIKRRQGSEQTDPSATTPSTTSSSPMVLSQLKSWFPLFNNRSSERANQQVDLNRNTKPTAAGQQQQQQPSQQQRSGTASNANRISSIRGEPGIRRSEEALRYYRSGQNSQSNDGMLTAARRASSWGQGDEPMEFAEVMSITSMDLQLNDNDYLFGVGGIEPRSYRPRPRDPPPESPEDEDDGDSSPICSPTSSSSFNPSSPREGEAGPSNYAEIVAQAQGDDVGYVFDGSSSSIVSGYGNGGESKWVSTLSDNDDSDDDEFYDGEDDPDFDGLHHRPRGETDSFDEGVTFSPRRRPFDDEDEFSSTPQ